MKPYKFEQNKNLLLLSSMDAKTPLAQTWSLSMWKYNNSVDIFFIQALKNFLLDKKEEILKSYSPYTDGGTGLDIDTNVTSRFNSFNLFRLDDAVIKKFKRIVIKQLKNYLETISVEVREPLYINCWYNVLEPGDKMSVHSHSTSFQSFLSGHYTVASEESSTFYLMPYGDGSIDIPNVSGEGIFFPSYTPHGTSEHKGQFQRISIAFDIFYGKDQVSDILKDNVVELNL